MATKHKTKIEKTFSAEFIPLPVTIQHEVVIRMLGVAVVAQRMFMTSELYDYFGSMEDYALILLGYTNKGVNSNFTDALYNHITDLSKSIDLYDEPRTEDLGREVLKKWQREFKMLEKNPEYYDDL